MIPLPQASSSLMGATTQPSQIAYLLKKLPKGIVVFWERLCALVSLCCLAKRSPLTLGFSSSSSCSISSSTSLGPSELFHQPKTQPPASPPAKPRKIHKGTGYPRKKKQNRKNNQSLNADPVEYPVKKLALNFLEPFLSLITSHQMKGTDCQALHSQKRENRLASCQFYIWRGQAGTLTIVGVLQDQPHYCVGGNINPHTSGLTPVFGWGLIE